jgi:REP element-mobilizing transposase RayT
MPRRDAPGALHHVTLRGVGQCDIFVDDSDRHFLFDRTGIVAKEADASIFAFAFMPNHLHAIIKTGSTPLATLVQRIATGYALYFNRRHGRVGHLFQNRYHAKPIRDEGHLRNSIRYAHVNPLAAGLVPDLPALERYRWAGHGSLMGVLGPGFLDVSAALSVFASQPDRAREALREFMADWQKEAPDDGGTVAPVRLEGLDAIIESVARETGIPGPEILAGSRRRLACRAREAIACRAQSELALAADEIALALRVTHNSLLRCLQRARQR